jgi:hypothetical protein
MSKSVLELNTPSDLCAAALEDAENILVYTWGLPLKTLIASNITTKEIEEIFREFGREIEYEISKMLPVDAWIVFDSKGHGCFSTGA